MSFLAQTQLYTDIARVCKCPARARAYPPQGVRSHLVYTIYSMGSGSFLTVVSCSLLRSRHVTGRHRRRLFIIRSEYLTPKRITFRNWYSFISSSLQQCKRCVSCSVWVLIVPYIWYLWKSRCHVWMHGMPHFRWFYRKTLWSSYHDVICLTLTLFSTFASTDIEFQG